MHLGVVQAEGAYLGDVHVYNGQAGFLIEGVASGVHHQGHGLGLPKGPHQSSQLSTFPVTRTCMQICSRRSPSTPGLSASVSLDMGSCI